VEDTTVDEWTRDDTVPLQTLKARPQIFTHDARLRIDGQMFVVSGPPTPSPGICELVKIDGRGTIAGTLFRSLPRSTSEMS